MAYRQSLLVIEPDKSQREYMLRLLKQQGYTVYGAADAQSGLACAEQAAPTLVLVDFNLPDMEGREICRRLRHGETKPIIALISQKDERMRVAALDAGADDCLDKPTTAEELLAQVRAALRRTTWTERTSLPTTLRLKEVEINFQSHQVTRLQQPVRFSRIEWALLELLISRAGKLVSYEMMHQQIWGSSPAEGSSNLRTYITRLRNKLEADPDAPQHIVTERGLGYVFRVGEAPRPPVEETQATAPPPNAPHLPPPNNLTLPLASFFGRETELEAMETLLLRDDVRLLTLTGLGGMGKTRLALQLARRLLPNFPDGAFLVTLAPIRDPELVAATITKTLGLHESGGQSLLAELKNYLSDKKMLLVLDNFEQVPEAAGVVRELLAASPLKVLVTSRVMLHLYGEREFKVPPLPLPNLEQLPTPEKLTEYPAIALFVERARAYRNDFVLTDANARAVAELCTHLDGLPLAIELAAARIKLFSPQTMLGHLSNRLELLKSNARDLPARQQTLRNALDWSYELLTPQERTLFARLSVFVGGCTLEAAAAITTLAEPATTPISLEDPSPALLETVDNLNTLVDQNLLTQRETPNGEMRFVMIETVQEYAASHLNSQGETEIMQRRLADYYLALAESSYLKFADNQQVRWLTTFDQEQSNWRAVLKWAAQQDPETAGKLAAALGRYWWMRGHCTEGRQWLEQLSTNPGLSIATRIRVLENLGSLALAQSDYAQSRASLEESKRLNPNQPGPLTWVDEQLGIILDLQGEYQPSQAILEQLLTQYRAEQNSAGELNVLGGLGHVLLKQNKVNEAKACFEAALILCRQRGSLRDQADQLLNMAYIMRNNDNYAQSDALCEEALALFEEVNFGVGMAYAFMNLGITAILRKQPAAAAPHLTRALFIFNELGEKLGLTYTLEALAQQAAWQEQLQRAAYLWGAAEKLREILQAPLPPVDQPVNQVALDAAHARYNQPDSPLSLAEFQAAWQMGRQATLAQAVAVGRDIEE